MQRMLVIASLLSTVSEARPWPNKWAILKAGFTYAK